MVAFDFFCGAGGLSKGLELSGIEVIAGFDIIEGYRNTYERNHNAQFICEDVRTINLQRLRQLYQRLPWNRQNLLLAGCAPCQPFSNQRQTLEEHVDRTLLDSFGRIINEVRPGYVLLENVPGIVTKGADVFQRFISMLQDIGYQYHYGILNAKHFGVPQNRKRFILIASRYNQPAFPNPTHGEGLLPFVTVQDAIAGYPAIIAGEENQQIINHRAVDLRPINLERIMNTPHSGGSRTDWPDRLILNCHNGNYRGHTDVYGRMAWDSVSPTLTARCCSLSNGRYGHPVQNRAISLREAARLQSFADDYVFFGTTQSISRQIGNAVPVLLAQALGNYILEQRNEARIR